MPKEATVNNCVVWSQVTYSESEVQVLVPQEGGIEVPDTLSQNAAYVVAK